MINKALYIEGLYLNVMELSFVLMVTMESVSASLMPGSRDIFLY